MTTLTVVPLTFRQACAFIELHHRHNPPPRGAKFTIGVADGEGKLRGVASAGRPVARHFDNGLTLEVNRTATDGCPNANSALYGACWRIARAMGYRRMITYTQGEETGVSVRAAGGVKVAELPARKSWAEHSVALKAMRDPIGTGGVQRALFEWSAPLRARPAPVRPVPTPRRRTPPGAHRPAPVLTSGDSMMIPLTGAHLVGCPMSARGGSCTCPQWAQDAPLGASQGLPATQDYPNPCQGHSGAYSAAHRPVWQDQINPDLLNDAVWAGDL